MSHHVTNQYNDSQFIASPNENILAAAQRAGRIYPSGCRSGTCGACKANLIHGDVDYGKYEDSALNQNEKSAGKLLLCQAKPLSNIVIEAKEVATNQTIITQTLACRISELKKLADDVMQINLVWPKIKSFNYLPGQYIDIILKNGSRRSFSIANLPEESQSKGLELHIRLVEDGYFTPRVFNSLRLHDILRFTGPFGTYFMQSNEKRKLIMVSGGTGFAPNKGIIAKALQNNPDQEIHFFWGARQATDLYMNGLVESWCKQYQNFHYTPVLSKNNDPHWRGEVGFVHNSLLAYYSNFSDYDIYVSGPPVMVQSVKQSVRAKGLADTNFYSDSFEYAVK